LYPHCQGYSQNLEYEKAKVVLKGSSVELYNSDICQTVDGPGEVVAQGWVRHLVLHQTEPCNLAETEEYAGLPGFDFSFTMY
jgi:hypothetical protein